MREKMIELVNAVLRCLPWGEISSHTAADIADRIIDSGICDESKWIPAAERLPENNQKALCIMQYDGEFRVLRWNYIDYMWNTGIEWFREKDVTHWMPLPEPPKGE